MEMLAARDGDDVSTVVKKHRRWREKLLAALGERIDSMEVEVTGHFGGGVLEQNLERWLAATAGPHP